jgi:hypothetical protein
MARGDSVKLLDGQSQGERIIKSDNTTDRKVMVRVGQWFFFPFVLVRG